MLRTVGQRTTEARGLRALSLAKRSANILLACGAVQKDKQGTDAMLQ